MQSPEVVAVSTRRKCKSRRLSYAHQAPPTTGRKSPRLQLHHNSVLQNLSTPPAPLSVASSPCWRFFNIQSIIHNHNCGIHQINRNNNINIKNNSDINEIYYSSSGLLWTISRTAFVLLLDSAHASKLKSRN
eukprot:GEZU01018829.1.p1 GENE.GEZU01018829.1~~GEZU01018829.1.p1  ORF type:complete len:132 (+),score=1.98 GEZU01018829.1:298-693(+)